MRRTIKTKCQETEEELRRNEEELLLQVWENVKNVRFLASECGNVPS